MKRRLTFRYNAREIVTRAEKNAPTPSETNQKPQVPYAQPGKGVQGESNN